MSNQTPFDAFCVGYGYAVRGIVRKAPRGTWLCRMWRDFYAGYDAALAEGKFGTVR